jgi:hypothetical protein
MCVGASTWLDFNHTIIRNANLPILRDHNIGRFEAAVHNPTLEESQ